MHYASPKHERLYCNITRGKGYPAGTLAALYLLTARRKLWKSFCKCVSNQGIEWAASRNIETGWDGYYLERAALSLVGKEKKLVTLHDLLDLKDYPSELILLVLTALLLARGERIPKYKQTRRSTC